MEVNKTIRFLAPPEYGLVAPVLAEYGSAPPDPAASRIAVAQDNVGGLLGLSVLQPTLHLEPVWVTVSERGGGLWEEMLRAQLDRLSGEDVTGEVFAFAPRPGIERLLTNRLGFEKLEWSVMRKQIGG